MKQQILENSSDDAITKTSKTVDDDDEPREFSCLLPLNVDGNWTDSPLGPPESWSKRLQAASTTIASFPFPGAIFWADEAFILYNNAWRDLDDSKKQGSKQEEVLTQAVLSAFKDVRHEACPGQIDGSHLLSNCDEKQEYLGIISPLMDAPVDGHAKGKEAAGVMIQLLSHLRSEPSQDQTIHRGHSFGNMKLDTLYSEDDLSTKRTYDQSMDSVPLDQHPFFHRFAEMLPSGLAILDRNAKAIFVNQHFYDLTTHEGDGESFTGWPQSIHEDDYERVMDSYHHAFETQEPGRVEFRTLENELAWRLLLLTPLGDENLQHVSLREYGGFICSIVDISTEKKAELSQAKVAKEAEQRKEQQERFIDMISHEIRNPLSAILHCTEDIDAAVTKGETNKGCVDIEEIKASLETISMCLMHQKNIVNDVLAFSKLDAAMLSLHPDPCQPSIQLEKSLKMFQPEFRKQNIDFSFAVDPSYENENVEWVMADLSRIGQIVINLITNAIKFTARGDGEKSVSMIVGANGNKPHSFPTDVVLFDPEDSGDHLDVTGSSSWGKGKDVYITVAIRDSGIGISKLGQRRLFERFRQATPKTEEIYGGTGLGLNISRKISQLHGGQIGVASEEGRGSTFSFYFKAKRTDHVANAQKHQIESMINRKQVRAASDKKVYSEKSSASLDRPSMSGRTSSNEIFLRPLPPSRSASKDSSTQPQSTSRTPSKDRVTRPHPSPRTHSIETPPGLQNRTKSQRGSPMFRTASKSDLNTDGRLSKDSNTAQRASDPHVLLVEDNAINQKLVRKKLETRGFRVTVANNGQEAIEVVKMAAQAPVDDEKTLHMILMDQEMPIMDGSAAAKAIRNMEKSGEIKHLPILGVSANVREERTNGMIESGMDDVIGKPYETEEMISKVKAMVLENASK